jgi:hypothetical protein
MVFSCTALKEREEVLSKRHPFHRLANGEIARQEAAADMSRYFGNDARKNCANLLFIKKNGDCYIITQFWR